MNAAADRTGNNSLTSVLTKVDGVEVHEGDDVKILRIEEPRPHSNTLDTSRII